MEEESKTRSYTVKSTIRRFLLIFLILVLGACSSKPPLLGNVPRPAPDEGAGFYNPSSNLQHSPADETSMANLNGVSLVYSEALLGKLEERDYRPADIDNNGISQPERILFAFGGSPLYKESQLLVYPVEHYVGISNDASSHLLQLKNILRDRPVQLQKPLTLFPLQKKIQTFNSLPTYIEFLNGNGISFVSRLASDSGDELIYGFQGFTDDEKFFVTTTIPFDAEILGDETGTVLDETLAPVADRPDTIDLRLRGAQDDLNVVFRSLEIQPQAKFPSVASPEFVSFPGVLLAYDPEISGNAVVEKAPPIYSSPDGSAVFLAGVPDEIRIRFTKEYGQDREALLRILPVRGATKQFYRSVPPEVQLHIAELEAEFLSDSNKEDSEDFRHSILFRSGAGIRNVSPSGKTSGKEQHELLLYRFQGVTEDGRYFVEFNQPITLIGSLEEIMLNADADKVAGFLQLLAQLDQMVESLIVAPDASTSSSTPDNDPDCILDAEFVSDVTIPDHTPIDRGESFRKIWRIRNTGTCIWTPAYSIDFAGGNPLQWSIPDIIDIVHPGQETEISVEIVSPEIAGNYQAWWQLEDDMGTPFGANYYVLFEAPPPATDIPGYGVIKGELSYPASGIPALTIYFLRTDGSQRFVLDTDEGWVHYENELPAGDYFVFARVSGDNSDSGGGYTEAAVCELTCEGHALIEVTIEEGKTTSDIDILDWYAPAGSFPLPQVTP